MVIILPVRIMVIKIDTSLFVQKPYLRTNYREGNIEEDIHLKNQYKIKNLPCPIKNSDDFALSYVDNGLNDPSILRNTAHVDSKVENLDNFRFFNVNTITAVPEHLTTKYFVDNDIPNSVHEPTLVKHYQDNDIKNFNLTNISGNTMNSQAIHDNQVFTNAYVDQFHKDKEVNGRDLEVDFFNELGDLVKTN